MAERNRLRDVFMGTLRRRTLSLGVAVCMSYGAQISILSLMPTILVAQGHSITKSLLFTLVMQAGSLVGALVDSTAARYVPRKVVLTVAAGLGCAAAFSFGFLANGVALILILGAAVNCCIITLNTTIWIFAPEQFPTRVRAFGTSIILALGSLAGGLTPMLAGAAFDAYGMAGMFTLIGILFMGLAVSVQFPQETFGDAGAAGRRRRCLHRRGRGRGRHHRRRSAGGGGRSPARALPGAGHRADPGRLPGGSAGARTEVSRGRSRRGTSPRAYATVTAGDRPARHGPAPGNARRPVRRIRAGQARTPPGYRLWLWLCVRPSP